MRAALPSSRQNSCWLTRCMHGIAQIAPMEVGRINIQYRRVECTPPEPLLVSINHNYGPGAWLRIVVSVSVSLGQQSHAAKPTTAKHHMRMM